MDLSGAASCSSQSFSFEKSKQYGGFIPNEALDELTTTQSLVYSAVQFLSFFGHKVTPASVHQRIGGLARSTVQKALAHLVKNRYILLDGDEFLFRNHKLDRSKNFLTAKEIAGIRLGCWVPRSVLASSELKSLDKVLFSTIKDLIGERRQRQISIDFLAEEKLSRSRRTISASISRLVKYEYLVRAKKSNNVAHYFSLGKKAMSNDDVFSIAKNRKQFVGEPADKKPDRTANATPIYSSNKSNIYYQDRRESTMEETVELRENNALIFLKDIIDYFSVESKRLEDWSSHLEKEKKSLSDAYTQACQDLDWPAMNDIGVKIAALELKEQNQAGTVDAAKNALVDHLFFLKMRPFAEVGNSHVQKIGKGVKALLPTFDSSGLRKQAFCLLMNSVICDLRLEFYSVWKNLDWRIKSRDDLAMNKAIDNCLKRASKQNYQVNHEIAMDFYKKPNSKLRKCTVVSLPRERFWSSMPKIGLAASASADYVLRAIAPHGSQRM